MRRAPSRHEACARPGGRARDAGQVSLWLLGLCVMLLFVGGMSLDLWRAMGERRVLAGIADTAALAGASGLDLDAYRGTGIVVLDPDLAVARALETVAAQDGSLAVPPLVGITGAGDVVVELHGDIELTLMRVLMPGAAALPMRVRSVASPREG